MKRNYETRARHHLARRTPVIVRVDGKAFHTFCKGLDRPFDNRLMRAMEAGARAVSEEMQGFKCAYIQSDEASFLLTDYDALNTEAWFDYVQEKLVSISASVMTAAFNRYFHSNEFFPAPAEYKTRDAHFDARAFNVPREEVVNYFLWRAKDWERNSVSMYCRAHFSHKEMHGQGMADQHEMLHALGLNWATDLTPKQRNGQWLFAGGGRRVDLLPNYQDVAAAIEPLIYCDR
jgi:tRNA(His) 5'-end guanylyltransferase